MTVKGAESQGYVLDMYVNGATEEFKQRLLAKMRKAHRNFTYIMADGPVEKECALMHKGNVKSLPQE